MANKDSDPPVTVPPLKKGKLVITANEGGSREESLTIEGKKFRLIVKKGDVVFQTEIDEKVTDWKLEIHRIG